MITISERNKDLTIKEDILNRLFFHTCIEFKLEHNLYPYTIKENYGKFNDAGLVVKYIIDTLKGNYESQIIDCTGYNVYFKNIDIKIDKSYNGVCSYIKYNNDIIYIEICGSRNFFINNIDTYIKLIMHELLHGYEDYNRIKNTGKGIFDFYNDKYENSFNNLNSQNNLKLWLSRCNYFLNDQERNAYLSQLEYDIEKLFKDEHITIENFDYLYFKDKLKKSDIWEEYFKLSIFILKLNNSNLSNEQKQYVESIWKQLYNENKTFTKIKNELYNNWQKFEKKFEQLVPKLICQYIETNLKEVCFDIQLINQLINTDNYWKNLI